VGYQGTGTLGRQIVEKRPWVTIHGQRVAVRAAVHTLGGFSAHAGQKDLLAWFGAMAGSRPEVFLVHGEDGPRRALAEEIRARHGIEAKLPRLGEVIKL
jgi:metallo-beta-lactamase family protein